MSRCFYSFYQYKKEEVRMKNILYASGSSTFPFATTTIMFINILRMK